MDPEQYRDAQIADIDRALAHAYLLGLGEQAKSRWKSMRVFFKSEVTPEELAVLASRVSE